jgi:hypothetical protein
VSYRCAVCGWPTPERMMVNVRLAELEDGELTFPIQRVCVACVSGKALLITDPVTRQMVEDTVRGLVGHIVKDLHERLMNEHADDVTHDYNPGGRDGT